MGLDREYFNIAKWLSYKLNYHKISNHNSVKRKQVNIGEIWECHLGYNIGEEKNKKRPILVLSNNRINRSGKIVVACITDAKDKTNQANLPQHNSWYLLFSNTTDPNKMHKPNRQIPSNAHIYNFLDKDSIVQLESIRTVSKARLPKYKKGDIHPDDFKKIRAKLKNVFNIS